MASSDVTETARQFAAWDPNSETRDAIEGWISREDQAALNAAFGTRLEFGTAGLRGEMGAGTARMNDLTVIQAAQVTRVGR
jgi:phosphomannomutase